MSRRIRLLCLTIGGLAIFAALLLFSLFLAARQEPAFYRQAMEIDPVALEKGSDRMVQQAAAVASATRKEGRWEALFTAEQINGWLAVDMVRNHPRTLPPGLHDPRVTIDSGRITIACQFERRGISSVLSLTVEPYVPAPNVLALRIVKARAGLLPAPLGQVLDRVAQAARDMHLQLQWRTDGGDPVAMLSFPSGSGKRSVRIETLRLGAGEIYVAGTTLASKPQ
jgi:hypothetical protein